jgi:hypothetical protein
MSLKSLSLHEQMFACCRWAFHTGRFGLVEIP